MEKMILKVNGKSHEVEAAPSDTLLWVIREKLKLTGTKYSCGKAICGSCTVHLDGTPVRSCVAPVASATNKEITTIEGLSESGLHPVQKAWIEEQVAQCGYCQSGQIMQAVALLNKNSNPSREEIVGYMKGNLCRCGAYMRIIKAIEKASELG
ncbi:(2Fe-2S)-binding protein [Portibacter marinus]|uniref:(2Fe-2S)-binding protein n=1 Tax=Portibacter marinus TaxID=2898660 RepID=UPI001F2139F5|nr:(2Fe-2S)-binding protein [Portibacter marinus]